MAQSKIRFKNIWADDSIYELEVVAQTSNKKFSTNIYLDYEEIERIKIELERFSKHIYGGIYDMNLGKFGSEYASGALSARFHFQTNGKINITLKMQSQFYMFGKIECADEILMYLKTEVCLLDNFINVINTLPIDIDNIVELECINE